MKRYWVGIVGLATGPIFPAIAEDQPPPPRPPIVNLLYAGGGGAQMTPGWDFVQTADYLLYF
jgi:hypothetical protein